MKADPKQRLAYSLLAALVLLHVVLAIVYANVTPYRTPGYLAMFKSTPYQPDPATGEVKLVWPRVPDIGAPDERAHANYVIHILEGKGIPAYKIWVPDPKDPNKTIRNPNLGERYEDHQAPLYYVLTAGFAKVVGVDATSAADPYAGLRLRYLNALFGALTIVGVFFLGYWGLARRDVALFAAGITALLPMNLALSGAMSNDPLLFAICTWVLALCALGVRQGWTTRIALLLGALVGLGLLTKTTALALIPLVIVAFLFRRPKGSFVALTVAVAILLSAPWLIRNQVLYGDLLGLKSFQELFADEITTRDFIAGVSGDPFNHWFNYVGWFTARSFFGVFGYMDIFLNERGVAYTGPATAVGVAAPNTLYRLLMAVFAVLSLGFLLTLGLADRPTKRFHALNGFFLVLVTLLFIRYNITFFQGQARYFFPAIGPISIGFALGAIYLAKSRKMWAIGSIIALLLALNIYALVRLPTEFAKRMNPNLANQVGYLEHPTSKGSRVAMRLNEAA